MADFASLIYGTAQNVAQSQGQTIMPGVQAGAELAVKKENLMLEQQKNQLAQQQLAAAKLEKLQAAFDAGVKMNGKAQAVYFAKDGYFRKMRDALGQTENFPDSGVDFMTASPENLAKARARILDVQAGRADGAAVIKEIMNPQAYPDMTPYYDELNKGVVEAQKIRIQAQAQAQKSGNPALQQSMQLLESARGNPAVSQAEKDLYAVGKVKSLVNLYGDPNKLSQPQVDLLVSELGKIASGGAPTMHELDTISSGALEGKMSKQYSRLINEPTPANAAAFIQQYADYAGTLGMDAKRVIRDKFSRVIESKKGTLQPDEYRTLKEQYLGGLDRVDTGHKFNIFGTKMSEQRAREFFKMHPGALEKIDPSIKDDLGL